MKKYLILFIVAAILLTGAVVLIRTSGVTEWPVVNLTEDVGAVASVKKAISQLKTPVTLESEPELLAIEKAYAALTDEQKAKISNYSDFTAALDELAALKSRSAAKLVSDAIDSIPSPLAASDRQTVEAALAAYDALSDEQKSLVLNYDKLLAAQSALRPAEVDAMIAALPSTVSLADADAVKSARAAYNALTEEQKLLCKNAALLSNHEATLVSLNTAYRENDLVVFVGGNIYEASNAEKVSSTQGAGSLCKISFVNENGLHRYHIISTDGRGVYGWVDAESIRISNGGSNNG